jgi:hypothetical protein
MKRVTRRIVLLVVMMVVLRAAPVRAGSGPFPLYDDPNSGTGQITSVVGGNNDNDFLLTVPVENFGPAHDIIVVLPLFNVNSSIGVLAWSQSRDGWYGANVDGTSLLVTVTSPSIPLLYSMVADETGLVQNVLSLPAPYAITTDPSASYPSIDLGVLQPNGTISTTIDFHFVWGDGRSGVESGNLMGYAETVTVNPLSVPEPSSVVMGSLSSLIGLGIWWRLRKREKGTKWNDAKIVIHS